MIHFAMNFNRFSFQLLFVLFTIYGSVIVMNLLVALMINHMNMDEAESLLQTHRVEEISDKIELATINKILRNIFCSSSVDVLADPTTISLTNDFENGQPKTYPTVLNKIINLVQLLF